MQEKDETFVKMSDILTNIFKKYVPYGYKVPSFIIKKLKITICCEKIFCADKDIYHHFFDTISPYVDILIMNEIDISIFAIKLGFSGLNPSLIALKYIDKNIYIVAIAKEGLINQKTAQKVINKLKGIFNKITNENCK